MEITEAKYLITTDNWFMAPDGQLYKAVWGNVQIVEDNVLGVKTNRNSSNWFAKVGSENTHVIVAGCQIHYAIRCEKKPFTKETEAIEVVKGEAIQYKHPTNIYIAE